MLGVCLPTGEGLQENTKKLRIVRNILNSTTSLCAKECEYTGGVAQIAFIVTEAL
jgi:hypothetical protein